MVGGLDVSQPENGDPTASNWFFSQPAFTIRGGTVRWTDDRLAAPVLELTGVSLHMRNSGRRHQMRVRGNGFRTVSAMPPGV